MPATEIGLRSTMTLLTAPYEPDAIAAPPAAPPAAPLLRFAHRSDEPPRCVPLSNGKYTIGSSPQCGIVLAGADVRPLQCLVAVEAGRVAATRWATGVTLNGGEFTKADLRDGDRLSIGDWEITFDAGLTSSPPDDDGEASDEAALAADAVALDEPPAGEADCLDIEATDLLTDPSPMESLAETPADAAVPSFAEALVATALVDEPPACDDPPAPTSQPPVEPAVCPSSQHFADSLVQRLWTANHAARRRAKTLLARFRATRFHADAMAADVAAMETELHLARAAYDSHLENNDRLQAELDARTAEHQQQALALDAQIAELRTQLDEALARAAQEAADHDRLAVEYATLQAAPPVVDPALLTRAESLEAAIAANDEQLRRLADQRAADEQALLRHAAETSELEARLAKLAGEADDLREQLEEATAAADRQAAEFEQLAQEHAELQARPPAIDPALVERNAELEAAAAACETRMAQLVGEMESQQRQGAELAEQLADLQEEMTSRTAAEALLRTQLDEAADAARRQAAEFATLSDQFAALQSAPPAIDTELVARAADLEAAVADKTQQLEQRTNELEALRFDCQRNAELLERETERTAQLEQELAERTVSAATASAVAECDAAPCDGAAGDDENACPSVLQLNEGEGYDEEPTPAATASAVAETESPEPHLCEASPPEPAPPAPEYAPPSFIEQYRHLLDDPAAPHGRSGGRGPLVIDEEFLSPAKAAVCDSPADDSDDALENYMANLMRRMRQNGATHGDGHAAPVSVENALSASVQPTATTDALAAAESSRSAGESLDAEPLKLSTRQPVRASDLAALREIANSSARTAIATHDHKQNRQSAMSKVALAVTATAAAAYLFLSAPAIGAWQIWAGVPVCGIGLTAAAQALRTRFRRR